MLKNVFTKIDLLDFHTTLQKGRGTSGSGHSMVRSHGEAESDGAEGFFPSLLREGLDNLAGLPARTKEAPSLSSGKATERFLAQTQQKETAADAASDEMAEKEAALSVKLLAADRAAAAAVPVSAKKSDDGEPISFPVAGQTLDETDGKDAAVETGVGFEKDLDADWFALGKHDDFSGAIPDRRPLVHVIGNQEVIIGSSECGSGLSLAVSSVGVRDGEMVRLSVDHETGRLTPREPITGAADSKGEPVDVVPGSLRDMTPSARGDQGDKQASASSFASASTVGVHDGKTARFPADQEGENFAPREPLTVAADSKGEPAEVVPGGLRDMMPSARGDQGDKQASASSFASASRVGVRDGKTARFPVDQEGENFAPREPLTVAADSKGEPAEVVPGGFRDMTPSARGDQGDKQASASSFASASTVGVRDGKTVRFPVDHERGSIAPREPLTGAVDSKGEPVDVVPGNLRNIPSPASAEESDQRAAGRNALDRQNAEMVNNPRIERVLPKGAGESIPAAVYEVRAAAGGVLPQKNLDRESLLRDAEMRFSLADFDVAENIRSTILKEAVLSSSKAQKEKSNLSGDEFSSRLAGNGAADIQATLSGRQVFSVEDSRPLESRTIAEQVMSQIPEDAFKSANRVRINLYPESLGKLDMEIVVRENRVHVFIIADRTDVVQALHGQQDQLKNALQSQGLQVSSLDFQWRENSSLLDDGSRSGDLWRHQNQDREQRNGSNEEEFVRTGNLGVLTDNVMRTQPLERTISVFV